MRFHSIIFSMMKVLTTAIIYDTKAVEHLKGKERSCCFSIVINELTTDVLRCVKGCREKSTQSWESMLIVAFWTIQGKGTIAKALSKNLSEDGINVGLS
ncbi:MAG: hypothetical protein QXH44_09670 [Pyrobaculum sp.]